MERVTLIGGDASATLRLSHVACRRSLHADAGTAVGVLLPTAEVVNLLHCVERDGGDDGPQRLDVPAKLLGGRANRTSASLCIQELAPLQQRQLTRSEQRRRIRQCGEGGRER
jgi:hypothetical protein